MKIRSLAVASLFVLSVVSVRAQFASSMIDYNSGTGFAAGYTNTSAALGAPASGSSVTPFGPPFAKSQLVSIGTNGSLTLRFDSPIINNPSNPFGLDFLIFGNTFFAITNGNFSGGGITSGALGGNNTGATRVEVSADGVNWFTLNPALAPTADNVFPTDGLGDPRLPVNPTLTGSSFGGLGLTGIRALYNGSAGGTGYDLAWAQDTNGNFVNLPIVRYVRVNVLSSKSEIDALAAVRGGTPVFADDFYANPLANGWNIFGDTNLFGWNSTNQNVEVTWDSTQPNSYLYHPLGTILAKDDAFTVSFDLQLSDIAVVNGGGQVSVGLLNFSEATNASFSRPAANTPDLFEFDYFPDTGFGDSIAASLADMTVNDMNSTNFYFTYDDQPMLPGVTYQVTLTHTAGSPAISGQVFTNGVLYTALPFVYAGPITDFRLDTLAVSSFHDDGFGDDILAHGTVNNFVVNLPPPPVQNLTGAFSNGLWQAQFISRSNWLYTLERTTNFVSWTDVSAAASGNGTNLFLPDTNAPVDKGFYRVRAGRP
ncbi:MAG: hypothetical protein HY298_04045 [Verrucomicrobia bacterium]|nr:hypothetical protein [Verrucomicrobiota bacterium]